MSFISLISVVFGVFLDNLLFNVLIPVLPFYAEAHGFDRQKLGWIVSGYTLALLLGIFGAGILTDRIGAKRVFLWGCVLLVGSCVLLMRADSLSLVILARMLQGLSAAFTWVSGFTFVAEYCKPSIAVSRIALLQISMGIAEFMGPSIGGVVFEQGGFHLVVKSLLGLSLLNLFLRVISWKEINLNTIISSNLNLSNLKNRKMLFLSFIYGCGGFVLSLGDPILPKFLREEYAYTNTQIGLLLTWVTLTYYAAALPLTFLLSRKMAIVSGLILSGLSLVALFQPAMGVGYNILILALNGIAAGLFILPVLAAIADETRRTGSERFGVAFSSAQFAYTLGMLLGPLSSTQFSTMISLRVNIFILAAIPFFIGLFAWMFDFSERQGRNSQKNPPFSVQGK